MIWSELIGNYKITNVMTAITEQTRNANKASRGLNTIMANLSAVLDDASSNGKKIVEIYDDLGLSMEDENGQLKSGYELLSDLSDKWDELDGNSQKYIATTIAGDFFAPSRLNDGNLLRAS